MTQPVRRGRRGHPRARGVLFILSTFLISSALVRVGGGAGQALALVSSEAEPPVEQAVTNEKCETPDDLQLVLDSLQAREARLDDREAAMGDRLHALDIAEQEIDRKMRALMQAEDNLRRMVAVAETAAENDVAQLIKVYEAMKPKQASAVFEEMDPVFAAGFLGRMRADAAAEIMAGMSPAAAHGISVILAGRNANVPRQ
ncbi:hypothetical protein [uncultured Roseovarius sp.]|uniref:MotE family protein n=1 Tax=uncultured Roseovarius sp. TaxID=293344 RepID=UPI00260BC818|nr:hypothetical protein [uncultured Roseovarius sp.]